MFRMFTFSDRWVHNQGKCRLGHHAGWGQRERGVFEGPQVVYDVVSHQGAASERAPVHHTDAEGRVEVLIFW